MKRAFTMVEILVAVTLSLLLLLGVTEMFRRVGTMIDDTTSTQNMTSTMNEVSLVLRNDLGGIDPNLASQPFRMEKEDNYQDVEGYLEITEGMNAPYSLINTNGLHVPMSHVALNPDMNQSDLTVGDVDDVLAFTAEASGAQFRGLINGQLQKSNFAQIIWFVRGTTLYRRLLLIDEFNQCTTLGDNVQNDVSFYYDGATQKAAKPSNLKFRQNRFAHTAALGGSPTTLPTNFPMPMYDDSRIAWFFLRMPTLEEQIQYPALVSNAGAGLASLGNTVEYNGTALPSPFASPPAPYQDFWQNPNAFKFTGGTNTWLLDSQTGSLYQDGTTPYVNRHPRAGDDIVLTNVLSFDVKVWNPYWVPCRCKYDDPATTVNESTLTFYAAPQFIDLGQDVLRDINGIEGDVIYNDKLDGSGVAITGIPDQRGYGFTLKGRYSAAPKTAQRWLVDSISSPSVLDPSSSSYLDDWQKKEVIRTTAPTSTSTGLSRWGDNTNHLPMPCVFDSWTKEYAYDYYDPTPDNGLAITAGEKEDFLNWKAPPPYSEKLEAIQITIRCFDPRSRQIKQVQVVHRFE